MPAPDRESYLMTDEAVPNDLRADGSDRAGIATRLDEKRRRAGLAIYLSVLAAGGVLFAIGIAKTRWTHGSAAQSGLEILVIGAFAGIAGYFFGKFLPTLLGAPALG
jgi:hypothetical protein